jgi:hypothetical protein
LRILFSAYDVEDTNVDVEDVGFFNDDALRCSPSGALRCFFE